jgi:hypothetical protein
MNRGDLIDRCKAIIVEAYEEATEMIVAYLETSGEPLQPLCKEIDPDNWNALRNRVQRAQGDRKAIRGANTTRARATRRAKAALRDADSEQLTEIMRDLPVEKRAAVVRAAVPPPESTSPAKSGPTFIEMLVRINSALIELEAMVAGWQNPAAVPAEFSRDSFGDIVNKALRIQDTFDKLVAATDDEDEFQKIVRNFRVAADVG